MSKSANKTNVPNEFPDITKLNDKRLYELFKRYRKMSNANAHRYDDKIVEKIKDRFMSLQHEMSTRQHIERDKK